MVRLATHNDAAAITGLMADLGYPSTVEQIRERLHALETDRDWVFVSDRGDGPIGVIAVHVIPLLHAGGYVARITALVVKPAARGNGAGSELVAAARTFARQTGCLRLEVTSNDGRTDAHAFYLAQGFREDERRFIMDLSGATPPKP
jgi:GNAT superfamily N-acetyltransferase